MVSDLLNVELKLDRLVIGLDCIMTLPFETVRGLGKQDCKSKSGFTRMVAPEDWARVETKKRTDKIQCQ